MTEVGLREMRQHASDLVRRAEGGERVTITVAGRPAAVLGPVSARTWRTGAELRHVLRGGPDEDWDNDRDLIDGTVADPWER
ncbi:MAG: type II toxin-antitoxin system Phd/YefM family antitoxin [Dermatophilaceae bacterium]